MVAGGGLVAPHKRDYYKLKRWRKILFAEGILFTVRDKIDAVAAAISMHGYQ